MKEVGACSAGNWITGLMLRVTQKDGAIMAFYNVGGIRTSLEIPEGETTREVTVYDMYTITPFANSLLLYDITGQELATLLQQGLNQPNYGDQMTGLTFTYTATGDSDTPRAEREYTIISVTLDDGTEVDINDTETLYRICTSNYNATMPDSIFEGKEPVIPLADAPIDNDEFIRLLREEKAANGGYIAVDTGSRGVCLSSEGVAERSEVAAEASKYPDFEPFYRIDRDNVNEWQEDLDNVRLLSEGRYEYQELDEKYGVDPAFVPSGEGLDMLNISGSAQFSEGQFRELAETLRECAGGDPIYVIDCRSESHALINGIAISYYELHNWGNPGMTLEEVEADEQERFGSMIGSEQTFYEKSGEEPDTAMTLQVESWMTEQELVESEDFGYLRLPALNNHWPEAALIDEFIEFVKGLDMEHVWLHFHCQAGKGRTVTFMCLYDMMKNPDVALEDIVTRQAMTGGNYLLYTEQSDSYKAPLYDEIAENIRLFYEYVQENHKTNYELSWSEWLAGQSIGVAA